LQFTDSTELTIATGAVSVTANYYRIDTEGDAASDDLDTITAGTGVADGHILLIRAENTARTVVVKHNTGNILCANGVDHSLDDSHDAVLMFYDGNLTKWCVFGFVGPLSIAAGQIAADAVTTAKILNANVTTAKIADAAVTADKLAAAVAGSGLAGGAGSALSVNVDGTSIQISGDTLSAFIVAGTSVNDYFRITNTSSAQKLVIGNQDSSGADNPAIISATNGALSFGGGDSWVGNGGTFTANATLTDGGILLVGDTANANMTKGLTLNQGAADNEILALKSSDVAHGLTDYGEADTYANFQKTDAAGGGLRIRALLDGDAAAGVAAFSMSAFSTNAANTTKTTAGLGLFNLTAGISSGTGVTGVGADGNLVTFGTNTTTRFIFDAEGSAHADVEWTTFDIHNDVALLESLERAMLDPVRDAFGAFVGENRQRLQELGIVNFYDDGPRAMVNMTRLSMLLVGAVRQVSSRLDAVLGRLENVERKLLTA
jgi:hypothetical protein